MTRSRRVAKVSNRFPHCQRNFKISIRQSSAFSSWSLLPFICVLTFSARLQAPSPALCKWTSETCMRSVRFHAFNPITESDSLTHSPFSSPTIVILAPSCHAFACTHRLSVSLSLSISISFYPRTRSLPCAGGQDPASRYSDVWIYNMARKNWEFQVRWPDAMSDCRQTWEHRFQSS